MSNNKRNPELVALMTAHADACLAKLDAPVLPSHLALCIVATVGGINLDDTHELLDHIAKRLETVAEIQLTDSTMANDEHPKNPNNPPVKQSQGILWRNRPILTL